MLPVATAERCEDCHRSHPTDTQKPAIRPTAAQGKDVCSGNGEL
ncbi:MULTISPECIES: cytochrome c3 family protein [unclassified Shewanella]